jgi:hypothetical protein
VTDPKVFFKSWNIFPACHTYLGIVGLIPSQTLVFIFGSSSSHVGHIWYQISFLMCLTPDGVAATPCFGRRWARQFYANHAYKNSTLTATEIQRSGQVREMPADNGFPSRNLKGQAPCRSSYLISLVTG